MFHGLDTRDRLQLFDDLFSGDLFGLYRASTTGRMLNCNQALANLLGYDSIGQLIDMPVGEHYFDVLERQRFIDDLLERKQLSNYEILLRHRSGKPIHVLENVVLREEPGRASVIEGVVIDITALRQSEIEQRVLANNYRQLTEQARDGMVVLQKGKVVYANPAAEAFFGLGKLDGLDLMGLVCGRDSKKIQSILEEVRQGKSPGMVRIGFKTPGNGTKVLAVHGCTTWHMNAPAVQLTLQDLEAQSDELRKGIRASMAEEMTASLREEIEEHKRTQEALEQSRRLARSLIDSSLDMIVAVDPMGRITEFNPAASIKFGYETEEILGKDSRILYADDDEYMRIQRELDRYGACAGEVRNITRSGKVFISFLAASRLKDEDGVLLGSMGVSRDVTQAKRDREALLESEERYRDVVDNASDLIHTVDSDGKILFANKAWRKTMGYTEEDLKHLSFFDFMVGEDERAKAGRWMSGDRDGPVSDMWRALFRTKDGRKLLCEGTSSVREVGGRMVMARSIFRDITESHAAQEKIRHHTAKEKALFESSDLLFWTADREIRLTSFNKGYHDMIVRLHGKAPTLQNDPSERKVTFAPQPYHDFWRGKYEEAFAGNKVHFETHLRDTQGQEVFNEIFLSPVFSPDGKVEEVFGVGYEVTAERMAERSVRDQAAKLHAIFESNNDMMIWTMDRDRRITSCNRQFVEAVRRNIGDEVREGSNLRSSFIPFISEEDDKEYQKTITAVLAGKHGNHELALKIPDGPTMWVEIFASPIITDGEVKEISFLAHDITGKKKAEQAILESLREKEALLKEVHHRVKNNLQIISSIFSLQQGHVGNDERSIALLRESQDRIRSMAFIHESLYLNKNFTQVDLAAYIRQLCGNLTMSYALQGRVRFGMDLQPLMLDLDKAISCGLVLNELISNALKHAFRDGREGEVRITLALEGNTVQISLADDGMGFPEGYDEEQDKGLGMELVDVLMGQLEGNAKRATAVQGTLYLITFERS
ncbi:MAG: PAS domain S-box protein [Flavobacteriales bacterium]|nr:PAS domain S-box protein [Flavobacteriales bacterium]MEB2342114.1 PAS domain S-box protein [Flavobacteriia bacterium]